MMLVREEGDDLVLASGTPRAWMQSGRPVKVSNAATRFGLVSFTLTPDEKEHRINCVIRPVTGNQQPHPEFVQVWLRAPAVWGHISRVTLNGKESVPVHGEMVQFPGSQLEEQVTITADFH